MSILDIYKKYQIMPRLGEHQLRVAAVAEFICEHWERGLSQNLTQPSPKATAGDARTVAETNLDIDRENIVAACLLHDMGNIVKFDLRVTEKLFPDDFKDGSMAHWEKVKQEFIGKYGANSHNATVKIIKEIGVSPRIFELVDCVGFEQGVDNAESGDFGKKICAYCDMRVMPHGVCSMSRRMEDFKARYRDHKEGAQEEERKVFEEALRKIERQIFEHCNIKPEDITETAIADIREKLKSFEV